MGNITGSVSSIQHSVYNIQIDAQTRFMWKFVYDTSEMILTQLAIDMEDCQAKLAKVTDKRKACLNCHSGFILQVCRVGD